MRARDAAEMEAQKFPRGRISAHKARVMRVDTKGQAAAIIASLRRAHSSSAANVGGREAAAQSVASLSEWNLLQERCLDNFNGDSANYAAPRPHGDGSGAVHVHPPRYQSQLASGAGYCDLCF